MKRGSIKKEESGLVALWIPRAMLNAIDHAVACEDSDRSKFIRRAVRRKLQEMGIDTNQE
jgi:metal-responsive CopG/Arc/MetJ family transcriptional regulator